MNDVLRLLQLSMTHKGGWLLKAGFYRNRFHSLEDCPVHSDVSEMWQEWFVLFCLSMITEENRNE